MKLPSKLKGQSLGGINVQAVLVGMAIMAIIVVVTVAFGLLLLANVDAQLATLGTAQGINVDASRAAIATGVTAVSTIPGWLALVILALVFVVILSAIALVAVIGYRMQGGAGMQ